MAFPVVLQTAQTECGLGVSASILQHYGRYQTVSDLRLAMEPGREGLNLAQVRNLLKSEGMEVSAYKAGSLEQLRNIGKPVILHWDNSHYVVLVRIRKDRVQIMDPAIGNRIISLEEAERSFSGSVLIPTPREDFEKNPGTFQRLADRYLSDETAVWSVCSFSLVYLPSPMVRPLLCLW